MPRAKIELMHLSKSFGRKQVLTDISLSIAPGESFVIIGGSGSGKSVLLKSVIGLMQPSGGEVQFDGENVTQLSGDARHQFMRRIGVLFQGGALFDSLPVWQNISFSLIQNSKMPLAEAHQLALKKLQSVGLTESVASMFPAELSGGMQKRVALARAIAADPEVIFFDEPTTGLDPIMTDIINNLITQCSQELGATTFTITHDMASVRKIADKVALLHEGKIIWHGTVEEMDSTDNPYVQQFIHGRSEGPIRMAVEAH